MKKAIAILLVLTLAVALCACDDSGQPVDDGGTDYTDEDIAGQSGTDEQSDTLETPDGGSEGQDSDESDAEEPQSDAAEGEASEQNELTPPSTSSTPPAPPATSGPVGTGPKISFSGTDIYGNAVDSSIFSASRLTMINIWATWCGPCVGELGGLAQLKTQLPAGVNLIGICSDSDTAAAEAQRLMAENGVNYTVLAVNGDISNYFTTIELQYLPTTIFVDSNGNMVGTAFVGAPSDVVNGYLNEINMRLS